MRERYALGAARQRRLFEPPATRPTWETLPPTVRQETLKLLTDLLVQYRLEKRAEGDRHE